MDKNISGTTKSGLTGNISVAGEAHDMQFGSDRVPDMHGVGYLELVKIPAILYSHTGNTTLRITVFPEAF